MPALPLASLVRLYGRHMQTVSIYPVPPGRCCTLCSSEQKLRVPAGPFGRPHAKQPAVLQGASGPCYISAEEVLPSVQTGHPGVPARPRDAELLLRTVSVIVVFSNACPLRAFSPFLLLLPVLLVRSAPWADCQGSGRVVKGSVLHKSSVAEV